MKQRHVLLLLFLLIFLNGCSQQETIVKRDQSTATHANTPELIEEKGENQTEQHIVFTLPYEQLTIDLTNIPILKEYLQWVDDPKMAVEKMNMIPIDFEDKNIYLLEFSCQKDLCSYLLLDEGSKQQSYLLADMAKFVQSHSSPDDQKILLQFDRKDKFSLPLSHLVVIDAKRWKPMALKPDEDSTNKNILSYHWPILNVIWQDHETISAFIPHLRTLTHDNIEQWRSSGEKTTEIIFQIEK